MNKLRLIRNAHAVRAVAREAEQEAAPKPVADRWPQLAAPVLVADTEAMARATSILSGVKQGEGALTPAQARDVIAWYEQCNRLPSAPTIIDRIKRMLHG